MNYYSVWVRSARYHNNEPLTYASPKRLVTGAIVSVELQKQMVLGFVSGPTTEPRFRTKPIDQVLPLPPLPAHLLRLAKWLQSYYPASLGVITQQFLPTSFSEKSLVMEPPREPSQPDLSPLPALTVEQLAALQAMTKTDSYLIHGKTGSGKTRIYIEMTARAIKSGKSAIILTPEISLTTQLAENFRVVFGNRVIVSHSQLAPSERAEAWLKASRSNWPVIIIGPRSALYSPVARLGLIVLDESHETAYKQEQAPQYQTGRVAAYLAQITRANLLLGSATPSISDYFLAEQKQKPIITLTRLARPELSVATEIIMADRKDLDLFNRSPHFSQALIKFIDSALSRGDQSLLYLNRRGTARMVMCSNCGWQALCPNSDLPLTYHGDSHELRCHSCAYHTPSPSNCPNCGNPDITFKSAGTKAIVEEVNRLFPNAHVARYDADNKRSERLEQNYQKIIDGKIDILVGTQLLAKGLDLPRLSTLGILLADTSLYLPDFSAQERTFQLISQVLGRIGRGHVAGRAVIQTYHPEHPLFQAAIAGDYQTFYHQELANRQQFLFPPYCYLLKLSVRRATLNSTQQAAQNLKSEIEKLPIKVRVEGPAPSFYERIKNKYQWQLIVKSRRRTELLKLIDMLPANWSYDIDPLDLL
ncbi:MAG TPA: primosomal protein N' [Candidatus Saccharimonadales bacterium]|nr:primosomal protein N' [Candidatus Saccharimonadales bacterium]